MQFLIFCLCLTLNAATNLQISRQDSSVKALLHFNENTGSSAFDDSGNGNTGTITGAAWTSIGMFGSALDFDGDNDYVSIADAPSLRITGDITLAVWIKVATLGNGRIISKESVTNYASVGTLRISAGGNLQFVRGEPGVSETTITSTATITAGIKSHLIATAQGTLWTLFVNGVKDWSGHKIQTVVDSGMPYYIGIRQDLGADFHGIIDEPVILNRAWSDAEAVHKYYRQAEVQQ